VVTQNKTITDGRESIIKRLLLTGFVPFLDFSINPTQQIVEALNGQTIGGYQVIGALLPVEFSQSGPTLLQKFSEIEPDVVISLGLAAGREKITPERVAINCNDGEADNSGLKNQDAPIIEGGPAAYFSTLPIRAMVNRLLEANIPSEISNTAGTYLCNNVMYHMLHYLHQQGKEAVVPAGFIHFPASHDLAVNMKRSVPSFSLNTFITSVRICIEELPASVSGRTISNRVTNEENVYGS
jgi:pyroglutamyl-peptidase